MSASHSLPAAATRSAVRVRVEGSSVPGTERAFAEPFTIGRGLQAAVHVDSGRVSRLHAEVAFEDGAWVLRDAGSTNGTYHDGSRVERVVLGADTAVRLGREGPYLRLAVVPAAGASDVGGMAGPLGSRRPLFSEADGQPWGTDSQVTAREEPTEGQTRAKSSGPEAPAAARTPVTQQARASGRGVYVAFGVVLLLALALAVALAVALVLALL